MLVTKLSLTYFSRCVCVGGCLCVYRHLTLIWHFFASCILNLILTPQLCGNLLTQRVSVDRISTQWQALCCVVDIWERWWSHRDFWVRDLEKPLTAVWWQWVRLSVLSLMHINTIDIKKNKWQITPWECFFGAENAQVQSARWGLEEKC